ncbi:serine carboxypeptidase-like 45 [Quercus suber]|uniref:serine carboxypeptidase-like 45 n=1 Tax=Quercus suber TaxID=58331 RepID=UPI000CE266F7|nr:serine carboxypeptidase-like 45 [Quercus suber]POE81370.1 serine carboxypeptidase-like 45 [Quercus suber]
MLSLPWKPIAVTVALLQLYFLREAESFPSLLDRINQLPGQPPVAFQQYSGYVTVDDKSQRALFYYFAEAEVDPASKPLVLWLNGGPGCSSLGVGAFSENGPFRPSGDVLVKNQYSWNREANMLYLETPIGVGFSYATDTASYEAVNDRITARDNLVFLQRWFEKFPLYRNRSMFITGESYAGHYVPQLAELMIQFNKKEKLFNLKGIALGNPVLEFATDFNSRAEYFWSHGLISDSTYKMFTSVCNYSRYVSEYYRDAISPVCSRVMSQVSRETSRFVDKYDVTLDVCVASIFSQSKVLSPQEVTETVDVCVEDETVNYLNRKDVQMALHARLVGVHQWVVCSNILDYELLDLEVPTISVVGKLIKAGVPVLVYSGDQDSVIPLTGSRTLVHGLAEELGLKTSVPYRVWFEGQQVGGWTQVYGNILSFATVRGASHEAPFSQPGRSLVLFKSFLEGQPLPEAF